MVYCIVLTKTEYHRMNSCAGKTCYTKKEAATRMNQIRKHGRKSIQALRPYYCDFCGWWHLGHDRNDLHEG